MQYSIPAEILKAGGKDKPTAQGKAPNGSQKV